MSHDPGRRKFLGGVLGLLGAAGLGWGLSARNGGGEPVAAPSTTTGPTTSPTTSSTGAPAGTTGAPPPASTTEPPTTTGPPATTEPITTTEAPGGTTQPPARQVEVLCRDAWGAQPPTGAFVEHRIERMTIHHTAAVLAASRDAPSKARDHQRYHQSLGWPDLAYHYLVDLDGNIYEGRPVTAVGDTATDYDPTGHFLVCLEGNYQEQQPTSVQLDSVVGLLAWASDHFDVSPQTIGGHRDWAATRCPGANVAVLIGDGSLAAAVTALARSGNVELSTLCGPEAATRVAAIESGAM